MSDTSHDKSLRGWLRFPRLLPWVAVSGPRGWEGPEVSLLQGGDRVLFLFALMLEKTTMSSNPVVNPGGGWNVAPHKAVAGGPAVLTTAAAAR